MDCRPCEPRDQAAHPDLPAFQHGKALAHHGHVAFVKVAERSESGIARDAAVNQLCRISPLLDRYLRDPWQRLAISIEGRGIPNHKYLGVSEYCQVILDAH